MTFLVALCLCTMVCSTHLISAAGGTGVTMEYESTLFDTSEVLEINILIDDADWQAMLENAINEEYVECDVEIAGETFYRVGIRPKGNTSLSSIYNDPDSDRYSFKLEFDQYIDGQTCFGLDKLILNNNYADATNMKEALIYDMYAALGADASLYNYAKVSVNGEYWGVYLALEAVEDSFLLRNYGTENGALYKPESMEIGGGGGGMFGGSGANLNYTDDDLDSYSSIWEGSVTDTTDSDHKVIVTALKNISEGSNLEQYMDIDNLLRYAAVHIFSVNSDSLSGSMAHNYYLYESDGQLNLLPWDYNLAFGGMGGMGGRDNTDSDSATNIVNSPIDDAWNATEFFDTLLADESYHHAYYSYMEQVADYILNGGFESFYHHTRSLIDSLVETDPTAFYTYDEYLSAVETFYEVVTLRGESIQGQLEGTIPSTDQEQQGSDALVDASHIDLNVMGSMDMGNMGGGNFNFGGMDFGGFSPAQNNQNTVPETSDESDSLQSDAANSTQNMNRITSLEEGSEMAPSNENATESNSSSQTDTDLPENFDPLQSGGEQPENFDSSQFNGELPENFDPSQFFGQMPGNFESSDTSDDNAGESEVPETDEGNGNAEEEQRNEGQQPPDIGNLPNRGDIFGSNTNQTGTSSKSALFYYGIAIGIMLAAFLFAMFYHRKPRKR